MDRKAELVVGVALVLTGASCGRSDSSQNGSTCPSSKLKLSGDLDAQTLNLTLPLGPITIDPTFGGAQDVRFGTQGRLTFTYFQSVSTGPIDVSGALLLPAEAPVHAQQPLCFLKGSQLRLSESAMQCDGSSCYAAPGSKDTYTFALRSLSLGGQCDTALAGSLDGCFTYQY